MTDQAAVLAVTTGLRPLASLSSPREVVRQFMPNWFTATMGTGILALTLAQFPLPIPGLHAVAEGLWLFNIAPAKGDHVLGHLRSRGLGLRSANPTLTDDRR